jgi:hypothetical protein
MNLVDKLRQGLRFVLMSMGVSSPDRKRPPSAPTVPRK